MTLIILLFALGLLFIAVEVIVPGGILGTVGALLMFGGCAFAFRDYGTVGGVLALLMAVALVGLALFIEFKILPRTKWGRRVFLNSEINALSSDLREETAGLIGQPAEALTMLSPTGYVRASGRRFEAFCQAGQVPAGTQLKIIGADNFRLIVTPSTNPVPAGPSAPGAAPSGELPPSQSPLS